ncbi:hypothetical protein GCM10011392_29640 [Wenxinia marina]|nr:hypothetical protein GCM10011392_29640 [Wenxinia marina]
MPDATALVALAAADWARDGGDPAACVGVADEASPAGIAVHCGTGDGRRSYHFDAAGGLVPLEPGA